MLRCNDFGRSFSWRKPNEHGTGILRCWFRDSPALLSWGHDKSSAQVSGISEQTVTIDVTVLPCSGGTT